MMEQPSDRGTRPEPGELEALRQALAEARETLEAIRSGEVDAVVVRQGETNRVFTLEGADHVYRLFVEEMNQGAVTLGQDAMILFANKRFGQLVHRDPAQLAGLGFETLVAPASLAAWRSLSQSARTGSASAEVLLARPDATEVTALVAASTPPASPGANLILVVTDLTEQIRFERIAEAGREARASEQRLRAGLREREKIEQERMELLDRLQRERTLKEAIIESSEDAIITKTLGGLITSWNQGAQRMFGYTEAEVVGGSILTIIPPERRDEEDTVLANLRAGKTIKHYLTERLCKDGRRVPVSLSVSPILDAQGRVVGASKIVRDITAQRQAEADQGKLRSQLEQAQKMDSLGSLAGGIAHDMNNVLAAILALASAHLTIQSRDSSAYKAFETIEEAATRGRNMVKSLLAFARQHPAEDRELDLNKLLRENINLLEHTTLTRVRFMTDLAEDLRMIRGDPSAILNVFMNLCVNAVDAMPDGGVLYLRSRNAEPSQVHVEIEDTGQGMSQEVLARAMDPFYTTKETGKGTGLGLSMAYRAVKAHHGRLELTSAPGRGTCVRIWFPATEGRPQEPDTDDLRKPDSKARTLKVLLVDDDELIQKSTRMLVETLGHTASVAVSGEAALLLLERGFRPDAVILDMNMPGLGGRGTLPRLRALLPTLPVLLATGRADQEALDLVEAYPRVTLMSKPFSFDELRGHLSHVMEPEPS